MCIRDSARGESPTVELDHWTKLRRDHRDSVQNHALGVIVARKECRDDFESLQCTSLLLPGLGGDDLAEQLGFGAEIEGFETLLDRRGAHVALEVLPVTVDHVAVEQFVTFKVPVSYTHLRA